MKKVVLLALVAVLLTAGLVLASCSNCSENGACVYYGLINTDKLAGKKDILCDKTNLLTECATNQTVKKIGADLDTSGTVECDC